MRKDGANLAHGALHYIMSQALLRGKLGTTTISIPLSELVDEDEGVALEQEIQDLVLKIEMKTMWDENSLEQSEFEGEFAEEAEEDN